MGWKSSSHAKWDCKYHVIWAYKRRKRVGDAEVRKYVEEILRRIGEEFGFEMDTMEVAEDHVHLFLSIPPRSSVGKAVGILKSISASRMFSRYPWLRNQFWSGHLWEDGYCVRSVGDHVTAQIIRWYIKRHKDD